MSKKDESLKLALVAERVLKAWDDPQGMPALCEEMNCLREALAEQPAQQPGAEHIVHSNKKYSPLLTHMMNKRVQSGIKQVIELYDSPEQPAQQAPAGAVYRYGKDSSGKPWHGIRWTASGLDLPDGTLIYTSPPAQQEPVAWGVDWGRAGDQSCVSIIKRLPDGGIEVLATEYGPPASKPWVGMTDEDIGRCFDAADGTMGSLIAAIEAKLKEKNT